ncbi:MAG: TIGR04053 family radical SAM/SPASM domain-containing protein [Sulfolobales archaeon]
MFRRAGFEEKPLIVFWEVTRACPLACLHCRAEAILKPLPGELSTDEGLRLIEDIAGFGKPYPLLVFTGGDPLVRGDLLVLAERARDLGIPFALAPAVSPNLWNGVLEKLVDMGLKAVSISIDSGYGDVHDSIRGVRGVFDESWKAVKYIMSLGVRVQVNTVVMRSNVLSMPRLVGLLHRHGVPVWEVFFLVIVGRARTSMLEELSPQEAEDFLHFLYDVSRTGIRVRTVEAPFFRRVAIIRRVVERGLEPPDHFPKPGDLYRKLLADLMEILGENAFGKPALEITPTRDGSGVIFISYSGEVYPSGFTPYPIGSVRRESIVEIYRKNPVLKTIKSAGFRGRCGVCEFRYICGGSRARAYASTGDPLESDPLCPYIPRGYRS